MAVSDPAVLASLSKESQCGKYLKKRKGFKKKKKIYQKIKVTEEGTIKLPEEVLQAQCEEYLVQLGLRYIHVPDIIGRLCRPSDHRISIQEKEQLSYAFKGVSDLLIFHEYGKYTATLVIELKVGKNIPDFDQKEFLKYCLGEKWKEAIQKEFDSFKRKVDQFVLDCSPTNHTPL